MYQQPVGGRSIEDDPVGRINTDTEAAEGAPSCKESATLVVRRGSFLHRSLVLRDVLDDLGRACSARHSFYSLAEIEKKGFIRKRFYL